MNEKVKPKIITAAEFEKNSIKKMATRPTRPSAYGASSLTPQEVKEYFDKNPEMLKDKINELIEYLPYLASDVNVDIGGTILTLASLAASIAAEKGVRMQDLLKVDYGAEIKPLGEAMQMLTEWLSTIENTRAYNMQKIDADRIKAYEEDGGYYFSENNWNNLLKTCNRVYVEQSGGRGMYGMYALSYSADPIRNAWYSKEKWEKDYAASHSGQSPSRQPYDDEYPLLDSVVQRYGNGQIVVPIDPEEDRHAASKAYVDKSKSLLDRYAGILEKMYAGTVGLAYDFITDHYRLKGLGTVPNGSHIEIASYVSAYPVTEIASNAFPNNTIKSIRVPATINKFGNNAFGWSGKVDIVFVDDVAKWAAATFEGSGSPVTTETKKIYIKDVYSDTLTIPEGVTKISKRAFMHWKQFKSILLPESLEEICETAFQYCSGLETLTIPAGVKSVGLAAIDRCTSLKTVLFEGKPELMESSVFDRDTALTDIYVKWGKDEIPGAPWAAPNAKVWYYSENQPTDSGNYWHYVDGKVTNWAPVYIETQGLAFIRPGVGYYPICIGIGSAENESVIVIPEMAGGDPVKEIGVAAFADALNVTTVVLPPFLETAYGGSLSSPSIKKVVVRKNPYGAHDDANNSWVYSNMFTSPHNELHYSDTHYINDGASAFCPVELQDYSGGSWSEVYVSTTGANTTLEELHVPWAEDHEWMNANRPWGLENATIIYESEESMV